MTLHFIDFDTWEEHYASSIDECLNDTERRLWDMHKTIPSDEWKLGKTLANKIED